jgi:ATP-dependent Lon protease
MSPLAPSPLPFSAIIKFGPMPANRIPLFPLNVVLLPGASLPLHIFEPRYRRMVARCLEEHSEFGVVLSLPKGIVHTGCTAAITAVMKRYDDGRMDILAEGRAPFRVTELFTDDPLTEAAVEYLEDDAGAAEEAIQTELLELYDACHFLVFGNAPDSADAKSLPSVAYHVAGALPVDLLWKQNMLDMRSEPARQKRLVGWLREWAAELEKAGQLRKRAGGNGHSNVN